MNTSNTGLDPAEIARGRRTLLGLAALFFVPLAIAFYLYYAGGWRPAGSTNHGELIDPARPLEDAAFTLPDGTTSARGASGASPIAGAPKAPMPSTARG